jgi:hypothetical protein
MKNNVSQVFLQGTEGVQTSAAATAATFAVGEIAVIGSDDGTCYATVTAALAANDGWYLGVASGVATAPFTQLSNVFNTVPCRITTAEATEAVNKVMTITVGDTSCETEYLVKVSFDSEAIAKSYGYNDMIETFSYTTGCCDDCSTACPSGNCAELAYYMGVQINNHPYLTAVAQDISGAAPEDLTEANWALSEAECDEVVIVVTGDFPLSQPVPCGQDVMELDQTMGTFNISLLGGFECQTNAAVVQTTAVTYGIGYPYQIGNMVRWSDGYKREFGTYRAELYNGGVAWPNAAGAIDATITGYDYVVVEVCESYLGANTLNPVVQSQELIVGINQAGTIANIAAIFA